MYNTFDVGIQQKQNGVSLWLGYRFFSYNFYRRNIQHGIGKRFPPPTHTHTFSSASLCRTILAGLT